MTDETQQTRIEQALEKLLHAADSINNPGGDGSQETPEKMKTHNEMTQEVILQTWEELAFLTGNQDLAKRHGFENTSTGPGCNSNPPPPQPR